MSSVNGFNSAFSGAGGYGNAADAAKVAQAEQQFAQRARQELHSAFVPREQNHLRHDPSVAAGLQDAMAAMNQSTFGDDTLSLSPFAASSPAYFDAWMSNN